MPSHSPSAFPHSCKASLSSTTTEDHFTVWGLELLVASVPTVLGVVASQSRGVPVSDCCRCLFHRPESYVTSPLKAGFPSGPHTLTEDKLELTKHHS